MTDTFYRVATDTGGTFTDFVVFDESTNDCSIAEGPLDTR
jgi:N-methylhydantoinase A/oxoprolinase/acetone carboxylase beta subunit